MKSYDSLYKQHAKQDVNSVFAHFYPVNDNYDEPFVNIAVATMDGFDAWSFSQQKFKNKYNNTSVPKLKNYLNYTFKRLVELEKGMPGKYFAQNGDWISFNTGLQNNHAADILAVFQKYNPKAGAKLRPSPDYVFKRCCNPSDIFYRNIFGNNIPDIAFYSTDSRDYVFNVEYDLDRDVFDHLFDRAKERAGLPNAPDEVVRNYLRGALENLIPKIKRNYKVAIPVYYVEESRMQMLLPFVSASNQNDISCFLVERDDLNRRYHLKTIYDLDQAYFAARLITRPDKDWLNP